MAEFTWHRYPEEKPELREEAVYLEDDEVIITMISYPVLGFCWDGMEVVLLEEYDGKLHWITEYGSERNVTHWMELPEPPEVEP